MNKFKKLALVIVLLGMMLLSGCRGKGPDFAIYLLSEEMVAAEADTLLLKDLPLQEDPFISMDDVVAYDPETHELTLTESAAEVIRRRAIPVHGMPFVVVARGERIFAGAFWTPVSSQSYTGIAAMPSLVEDSTGLFFNLGYPESPELFEGVDLRNDEQIIKAFTKAEKLIEAE